MKLKNSRLREYINNATSTGVRSRAVGLKVLDLNFSPDYKSVSATVRGSQGDRYSIHFYGLQMGLLSSSCTCPFDYGTVCKHEVAVAHEIDAYMDCLDASKLDKSAIALSGSAPKPLVPKKKYSSREPIEIPFQKVSDLTDTFLKKYASSSAQYDFYYYGGFINIRHFESNHIMLDVEPNYYRDKVQVVNIYKKEGALSLLCSCKTKNQGLCIHQVTSLRHLAKNAPYVFMTGDELDRLKNSALAQFGFSTKDNGYKEYFDFGFSDGGLEIIPKDNGIVRLSKFKDHEPLIKELFLNGAMADQLPFSKKNKKTKKKGIALGVAFHASARMDEPSVLLIPIKGNLKKDGSSFVSKIEEIYAHELLLNPDGFSDSEISVLQKSLPLSLNAVDDICRDNNQRNDINHYVLTHLLALLPQLGDTWIYDVNLYEPLTKNNIIPISLSAESSQLSFTIEEEPHFYVLVAHITIAGRKNRLSKLNLGDNFLFAKVGNTYYLNRNLNYAKTLAAFRGRPEIRIKKEDYEGYYSEFILPLSKKYEVITKFKKYKSKKLDTEVLKKQIYLSEAENHILLKPVLDHNGTTIDVLGPQEILETIDGTTYKMGRDGGFERDFIAEVKDLHPHFEQQEEDFFFLSEEEFLGRNWFLEAFETLKHKDIEVFGFKELTKLKYNPNRPSISMNISSGLDWFDVSVSVAFGDLQVSLKDLKKSVVAQDKYIRLSDGSIGILPEEWLKKYTHLFRSGTIKKDKVEVSKYQLSVIDSLYEELDQTSDLAINHGKLRQKLSTFTSIDKVAEPKGIKATLRNYQKEGLNWLNFLEEYGFGGCLADDMGLGKTLQVISFLQHLKKNGKPQKPHLIVVPTSLIFNWLGELKKFCPSLKALNLTGSDRTKTTKDFNAHDLVITTYGTLLRDIALLKEYDFEYVVLDESQAIKNPNSQRYKAVRMLKAKNRLVLTGTPIENNTFDLYAQMTFINPGLLGGMSHFKSEYATPIDKNKDGKVAEELRAMISPFLMRRTKEQVATELPPKTEQILYCNMGKAQQKVYDAYRNKYRDYLMGKIEEEGLGRSKMYVLEGLTKLRQICDSPRLLPDGENLTEESVKIDELMSQILERTGNHKLLIFSQFVKMLQLIKGRLEQEGVVFEYLDGKTKDRQEKVDNFQGDDKIRVFLISLKAGGIGLNLTAADYVYIVDPWWNPAVEAQAIDRCYRIGQDKKVMAYKMICQGTIEEKIMTMQAGKKQLSADIVQTDESFVKSLSKESISKLFS